MNDTTNLTGDYWRLTPYDDLAARLDDDLCVPCILCNCQGCKRCIPFGKLTAGDVNCACADAVGATVNEVKD